MRSTTHIGCRNTAYLYRWLRPDRNVHSVRQPGQYFSNTSVAKSCEPGLVRSVGSDTIIVRGYYTYYSGIIGERNNSFRCRWARVNPAISDDLVDYPAQVTANLSFLNRRKIRLCWRRTGSYYVVRLVDVSATEIVVIRSEL